MSLLKTLNDNVLVQYEKGEALHGNIVLATPLLENRWIVIATGPKATEVAVGERVAINTKKKYVKITFEGLDYHVVPESDIEAVIG